MAMARPGQEQELSAMLDRFANAVFGQQDCMLDISAGADSRADRTKAAAAQLPDLQEPFSRWLSGTVASSMIASVTANSADTAASPGSYSPTHRNAAGALKLSMMTSQGRHCLSTRGYAAGHPGWDRREHE